MPKTTQCLLNMSEGEKKRDSMETRDIDPQGACGTAGHPETAPSMEETGASVSCPETENGADSKNNAEIPHVQRGRGRPRAFDREEALNKALEIFWRLGYEPASVALLCSEMGINPPSLYASFGNKAQLFLEAVRHYEKIYWEEPARSFMAEPNIYCAVEKFFLESAKILISPDTPCGCMVVLAAVNISEDETEIRDAMRELRMQTRQMFSDKLREAIKLRQIPASTDVPGLSGALNTFLEGMSLQAKDGIFQSELSAIAAFAVSLLPPRE